VQSSNQIITTNKPTPSFLQAGCPSGCPAPSKTVICLSAKNFVKYFNFDYLLTVWAFDLMPRQLFCEIIAIDDGICGLTNNSEVLSVTL